MAKNDLVAAENRAWFRCRGMRALNFISSPGAGKTSLLEAMAARLGRKLGVITGDIQMTFDADRIAKAGAQAVQIETGGSCHLTAEQIRKELLARPWDGVETMVIENIGNLICPSTYELGEFFKVALLSVTEGDEKPAKYPALFLRAEAVLLTKIDLLPHVNFDVARAERDCLKLNADAKLLHLSCKTGQGLDAWMDWLSKRPV
ncbi:MAG: hydrogenase nickel incorporation protein HypB [Spirochaetes bacterium]|nr:hydrogenase nickel incorporation protein HypB [Spirochaetota bacterium]